jgi:hypothetical protein
MTWYLTSFALRTEQTRKWMKLHKSEYISRKVAAERGWQHCKWHEEAHPNCVTSTDSLTHRMTCWHKNWLTGWLTGSTHQLLQQVCFLDPGNKRRKLILKEFSIMNVTTTCFLRSLLDYSKTSFQLRVLYDVWNTSTENGPSWPTSTTVQTIAWGRPQKTF